MSRDRGPILIEQNSHVLALIEMTSERGAFWGMEGRAYAEHYHYCPVSPSLLDFPCCFEVGLSEEAFQAPFLNPIHKL